MTLPVLTAKTKRMLTYCFAVYLVFSVLLSILHYMVYQPPYNQRISKMLGSPSWGQNSKLETIAVYKTRAIADFDDVTLLILAVIFIILTIIKKKNLWYLLATITTILISAYFNDAAYYLPN